MVAVIALDKAANRDLRLRAGCCGACVACAAFVSDAVHLAPQAGADSQLAATRLSRLRRGGGTWRPLNLNRGLMASTRGWRPSDANPPARAEATWGIPPYRRGVNSGAAATVGMSELQRARGREKATYRWIRLLGAA